MTIDDTARTIASALRETRAVSTIRRVVQCCGADQALDWLAEAQTIEANGGLRTRDGTRRRTPGGVFLFLARTALTDAGQAAAVRWIFHPPTGGSPPPAMDAPAPPAPPMPPVPPVPPLAWEDRGTLIQDAEEGKALTVKMTVIGRPTRTVERPQFTLLMLTHSGPLPSLPKGIPVPAPVPETKYILYIAAKQWNKVKDALANPADVLIVEGVPIYDAPHGAIAVFAIKTTTKLQQQQAKQEQQRQP